MSVTFEISSPIKKFYGTSVKRSVNLSKASVPVQVLGLSPMNTDNSSANRPCFEHHVFYADKTCFLFDFPFPFTQTALTNPFRIRVRNMKNPPFPNADITLNLFNTPYTAYYPFGYFPGYPNRSGFCFDWGAFFDNTGWGDGDVTFFLKDTAVASQTFKYHDSNDTYFFNNSLLIKTISKGIFRNYRFFDGSVEPILFDLEKMQWTDYLRVQAQIIPKPSSLEKSIVTYSAYSQEITNSSDELLFDLRFKGQIPTYIVRRFEFYGLNSELFLTDNNTNSFDTFINRKCLYAGSHDFDVMKTQPYIFAPTFSTRDYKKMGYDNRVQII
jgi:hypothetical protein